MHHATSGELTTAHEVIQHALRGLLTERQLLGDRLDRLVQRAIQRLASLLSQRAQGRVHIVHVHERGDRISSLQRDEFQGLGLSLIAPTDDALLLASAKVDSAHRVLRHRHTVAAHQRRQRRDDHERAVTDLAVADRDASLHPRVAVTVVARGHSAVTLEQVRRVPANGGSVDADVHAAIRQIALRDVHVHASLANAVQRSGQRVQVVDDLELVRQERTAHAVALVALARHEGADQEGAAVRVLAALAVQPAVHVGVPQVGALQAHLADVVVRDAQLVSDALVHDCGGLQHGCLAGHSVKGDLLLHVLDDQVAVLGFDLGRGGDHVNLAAVAVLQDLNQGSQVSVADRGGGHVVLLILGPCCPYSTEL